MRVEIELNEEQCQRMFEKEGYVVEEVLLYYCTSSDPYGNLNEVDKSSLGSVYGRVVYKKDEKPKELLEEHPDISKCQKYIYNNMVNQLFSRILFEKLI